MALSVEGMSWLNEPPAWEVREGRLVGRSGERTDFWQGTYYGFRRDDGHVLWRPVAGEFTAMLVFEGRYEALYDQAGLMVRADARNWLKCGIEHTDGDPHLSVVVTTRGQSDWSAQRVAAAEGPVAVRVTRLGDAMFVQHRLAGGGWAMARLAHFPAEPAGLMVGPMFCSPQRAGFEARFLAFEVGPPVSRDIH